MSLELTSQQLEQRSVKDAIVKGLKCRCPRCGDGKLFDVPNNFTS